MDTLGPFTTVEPLGAGALGELFRARDNRTGQMVALRLVDAAIADDPARREALLTAVHRAKAVSDPHVPAFVDDGQAGDRLYLAFALADGQPLSAFAGGRPVDVRTATEIAEQVADLLASASSVHGVVHGALEPASILVAPGNRVCVLHLGLAQWTGHGAARRAAAGPTGGEGGPADSAIARQARYISPEQALGEPADHKADLFTLGVILYEMLTGQVPFEGSSPADTIVKIVQATPVPPSQLNPAVSPALDTIVLRALAKSRDARYSSGHDLAADLRGLTADLAASTRVGRGESRPVKGGRGPGRRSSKAVRAAVLAGALLVALAAAGWFGRNLLGLPWRDATRAPAQPVVVVMPFSAVGDQALAYVGIGFAEDLAARLAEIPGTTVVGRLSIRQAKDEQWQSRGRVLRATAAIRGTVRFTPGTLEIDIQLFDVRTGEMTWSERFSRDTQQALGLEAVAAGEIARKLGLPMPTGARWARNVSRRVEPTAYDLYLQGRDAAERRDRSRAIALFDQAIERDSQLVEARASLAQALYLEEFYAGGTRDPGSEGRAIREAEAALAVDPDLPAAHMAVALASPTISRAASALARAISADPSNGEAWHHAGDLLSELDPERAIPLYRASLVLEPTIDANHRDTAAALAALGDRAEAERAIAAGEAARPDRPWWKQMRARLDIQERQFDRALAALATEPSVESTPIVWAMARVVPLAMAGRAAEARKEGERLVAKFPVFCEGRALLAGADVDSGERERGEAAAREIMLAARHQDAPPSLRACAALAAAGMGQAAQAGDWLGRVAADDRAFRLWTRQATFGLGSSFRSGWYPWSKVAGAPQVIGAAGQLDRSAARARDEVLLRLPALPAFPREASQ